MIVTILSHNQVKYESSMSSTLSSLNSGDQNSPYSTTSWHVVSTVVIEEIHWRQYRQCISLVMRLVMIRIYVVVPDWKVFSYCDPSSMILSKLLQHSDRKSTSRVIDRLFNNTSYPISQYFSSRPTPISTSNPRFDWRLSFVSSWTSELNFSVR